MNLSLNSKFIQCFIHFNYLCRIYFYSSIGLLLITDWQNKNSQSCSYGDTDQILFAEEELTPRITLIMLNNNEVFTIRPNSENAEILFYSSVQKNNKIWFFILLLTMEINITVRSIKQLVMYFLIQFSLKLLQYGKYLGTHLFEILGENCLNVFYLKK